MSYWRRRPRRKGKRGAIERVVFIAWRPICLYQIESFILFVLLFFLLLGWNKKWSLWKRTRRGRSPDSGARRANQGLKDIKGRKEPLLKNQLLGFLLLALSFLLYPIHPPGSPLPSAPGRGRGGTSRRSLPSIYSGNGNSSSKEEDERLSNGLKEAVPSVILQRGKIHRLSRLSLSFFIPETRPQSDATFRVPLT